jgi:hypothetical protein
VNKLRIIVATVVSSVWAGGCGMAFISRDAGLIGLATVITPVMLGVVGWLFTLEMLDRKRRIDGHERTEY